MPLSLYFVSYFQAILFQATPTNSAYQTPNHKPHHPHPVTPVYHPKPTGHAYHPPHKAGYSPAPVPPYGRPHHLPAHPPKPPATPDFGPPACAKNNTQFYCLDDYDYPAYEIQHAVEYHYAAVAALYKAQWIFCDFFPLKIVIKISITQKRNWDKKVSGLY